MGKGLNNSDITTFFDYCLFIYPGTVVNTSVMFLIFITIAFFRHVTARQAKKRSIFTDMSKLFRAMSEEVTASSYP